MLRVPTAVDSAAERSRRENRIETHPSAGCTHTQYFVTEVETRLVSQPAANKRIQAETKRTKTYADLHSTRIAVTLGK
ncbi:hypothetical protein Q9966_014273 [Columba livia]|nr:hypothetical protein Q9966_014273 [Columba livia]